MTRRSAQLPRRRADRLPRRDLGRAGGHPGQLHRRGARAGQHPLHRHPELERRLPAPPWPRQHAALQGHGRLQRRRAAPACASSRRAAAPTGPTAASFVHIGGRPYRMHHDGAARQRRASSWTDYFGEPYNPTTAAPGDDRPAAALHRARAQLPQSVQPADGDPLQPAAAGQRRAGAVRRRAGRLVARLRTATWPAGRHEVRWDGGDAAGRAVASGTYYARLRSTAAGVEDAGVGAGPLTLRA